MAIPRPIHSTYRRYRRTLGRELRASREAARFTGNQFAKRLSWPQSKVSRIETGRQIPTEDDLSAWCKAANVSKGERGALLSLLHQAETEYRNWKDNFRLAGGAAGKQREIMALESSAKQIRLFQTSVIPGLLQTPAYADELIRLPFGPRSFGASESDLQGMVAARLERQRILYDNTKIIRAVVLEAALTIRVCSIETLREQLRRLIDLCALRSLAFGIVSTDTALPIMPIGGFAIYDEDVVVIETLSGEQQISLNEEILHHSRSFAAVSETAAWGDDAAEILRATIRALEKPDARTDDRVRRTGAHTAEVL